MSNPGALRSDADDNNPFRQIPSVERILSSDDSAGLISRFGREHVKREVVRSLEEYRKSSASPPFSFDEMIRDVTGRLERTNAPSLRRVINASGVIIHTNLGRSPVSARAWESGSALVTSYTNLEFDLEQAGRGKRDVHLGALAKQLFGCEAAILVNNNASAVLLVLAALAGGKEVLVSRGELVEIGGAFRVPDVISQGGAILREIGTTNRTRASDYEENVTSSTAALLRVHRSNFEIVGFTETPSIEELVGVSTRSGKPLVYDEGSGRVVDLAKYGFRAGETIAELLASGVDVLTCSTDKLIGASQGGLILGRRAAIEKCARHPLMRALRAGKESYAIVLETLRSFLTGRFEKEVPVYRMLATPLSELERRADSLRQGTKCGVVETKCALGGGTTPTETISSIALSIPGSASALATRMLGLDTPIVGRVENGQFLIDLRTVFPDEDEIVARAIEAVAGDG